jgi:uncharacterized protein YdiU (UPF0061 family)
MKFSNSYILLDPVFYEKIRPTPVQDPQLFLWNDKLAEQLMVPEELKNDSAELAKVFSGNKLLPGSDPIAMAYAGHQFASFVPRLGDGRAHLLGEVLDHSGARWDIQLKGSGPTSFSRGGDGRCAIGPAVREFIMSEAMYALGVPTTRCLAVATTGEAVFRERPSPGAVVTRVASSHLRIGTFQYFAAREDHQSVKTLCDYTIARHYPELQEAGPDQYIQLIDKVFERQVQLVVEWMRVGFIHGVMNTDNTSLAGETIDYGPCAMMGVYDPKTVYSSIDTMGRYAFGNQPYILFWNMARFAECLLPLIDEDSKKAVKLVEPVIAAFPHRFDKAYLTMMGRKLGMDPLNSEDQKIITSILGRFKDRHLDYTITFDLLTKSLTSETAEEKARKDLGEVFDLWGNRLSEQEKTPQEVQALMRRQNPMVIPRNHHMEKVLEACEKSGKNMAAEAFLQVLRSPYEAQEQTSEFQDPPGDGDKNYKTFCGT